MNSVFIYFIVVLVGLATGSAPDCTKIPDKNPDDCCTLPKLVDTTIFQKCESDFGTTEHKVHLGCCVAECVLNTTKINENGVLNKENAKLVLKSQLGESVEWGPIIDKAIDVCTNEAAVKTAEFLASSNTVPSHSGEKVCNPLSGLYVFCIHAQLFTNCPKFTTNDECNSLKLFIEKCPNLMIPPKAQG